MNNANNPYCAVNADGSSRGAAYSPAAFIAAWRRVVTVLRGGAVSAIDAKLAALGQPALRGVGAGGSLAQSPIAFVWTPETAGTPNIATNSAATYYPGNAYVDWVGTDFYSKFPNFTGLDTFYHAYPGKPFAFGEWAIWGGDDPSFVNQLFAWVNSHKRVQMMVYNQGYITNGPFRLNLDPLSAAAIRTQLVPARSPRDHARPVAHARPGGAVRTLRGHRPLGSVRVADLALASGRDRRVRGRRNGYRDRQARLSTIAGAMFESIVVGRMARRPPAKRCDRRPTLAPRPWCPGPPRVRL